MALRPAPIQVEYMGSHDSLGSMVVADLFVTDRIATPADFADYFAERLLVVPPSFFINEYAHSRAHVPAAADALFEGHSDMAPPPKSSGVPPEVAAVQNRGGVVACNFNQLFKLDPPTLRGWLRLLRRVPDAAMWLLQLPASAEARLRIFAREDDLASASAS
eukprot:CAMPEP_0113709476 /NCGR_PEP_ID=MMETSP0038_2-20120614/29593_1 /TAXON_ID=2898 /ORGANISM="Cryptomonas paramecium" /LENGTH=161 /DNA_ID=CAMNT_0000635367 /DNA_START=23 /DNA_END=505 /DNA_ORIENTATION=+ /assembly_acc=CAM_ASM_000170